MPSIHRRYADWNVERIRHEAAAIGPATAALCELILERGPTPNKASAPVSASCAWCVRSAPSVSKRRQRGAIEIGTLTYGSVRSILDNKLDRQPAQDGPPMVCQSSTPISADPATTINRFRRMDVADPSDARPARQTRAFRHGPSLR